MALTRIGALTADTGYNVLYPALAADHAGNFIYAGGHAGSGNNKIAKISTNTFTQVAGLSLGADINEFCYDMVIDNNDVFMYVAAYTGSTNTKIHKIRLSDFSVVSTLTENYPTKVRNLTIDNINNYLYAQVYNIGYWKINLISFSVEDTISAPTAYSYALAIDETRGFLYSSLGAGQIERVDLSDFYTRISLQTSNVYQYFLSFVIDGTGGFLYCVTEHNSSSTACVKINLIDFTEVGYLTIPSPFRVGQEETKIVLDTALDILYISGYSGSTSLTTIKAVYVNPFVIDSSLTLQSDDYKTGGLVLVGEFLYFSCNTSPGKIVKMSIVTVPQTPAATDISLRIGFPVTDTDGNSYTYGTTDLGFVKRLENGTTFDGYDIDHEFHTGDILVGGSIFAESFIRNMKLVGVAKTVTGNSISITHYGDSQTSSNAYTMLPTNSGYRIFNKYVEQVFENSIFHSFKATMTTDDETIGFEPLYIGLAWQLVRTR